MEVGDLSGASEALGMTEPPLMGSGQFHGQREDLRLGWGQPSSLRVWATYSNEQPGVLDPKLPMPSWDIEPIDENLYLNHEAAEAEPETDFGNSAM